MYSIYAIRCRENGKIYVGCTYDVPGRLRAHFEELKKGRKRTCGKVPNPGGASWQHDYDQYGKEAFEYYILQENITSKDKASVEAYWINRLHSKEVAYGYNAHHAKLQPPPFPFVKGLPPEPRTEDES